MAVTLEDLDRRVTVLEKGAEREKNIERAVAEIVSESEQRIRAEMSKLRGEMSESRDDIFGEMSRLRTELRAEMHALTESVSDSERRFVDLLNDRFDQVMVALDRSRNPPKD
jgi:hypothetical protein